MRNFSSKLAPVIKEYLEHRSTLGYSDFQERSLEMFDAYCHEHYPDTETITREIVREWINFETSRGFTGMYNRVPAVRLLAQYMGNGAYILPPKSLPPPKPCRPYILSDDELSRLFAAADNINGNFDDSVKLMFPTLLRLQYTCGLRPYEVRSIEQKHIDLNTGEILITKSKKHRERIVVMSDDTLKQCRKYDGIKKVFAPKSEYFFVRYDNTPISSLKLWLVFNRCWQQANPDIPANMLPRVRPYDLRHRFASAILQKWLDYGKDLYAMLPYLQAYMGHENFSHGYNAKNKLPAVNWQNVLYKRYLEPLDWLEFNLERSLNCTDPEEKQTAIGQSESMIREAIGYSDRIEKLEKWLSEM